MLNEECLDFLQHSRLVLPLHLLTLLLFAGATSSDVAGDSFGTAAAAFAASTAFGAELVTAIDAW